MSLSDIVRFRAAGGSVVTGSGRQNVSSVATLKYMRCFSVLSVHKITHLPSEAGNI